MTASVPTRLQQRLQREYGLDETFFEGPAWNSAIRKRMTARAILAGDDYWAFLAEHADERLALARQLAVPESRFWRDGKPFYWITQWARRMPGATLRVLSLPCAAGQEPCSAAIAMFQAKLSPSQFRIKAADLCENLIATAHAGLYPESALSSLPLFLRQKYFRNEGTGQFRVNEGVRRQIDYQVGNCFDDSILAEGPWDLIICRNLLIYFTAEARRQLCQRFQQYLQRDGILLLGHADASTEVREYFQASGPAGSFTFQRRPKTPAPKAKAARRPAPQNQTIPAVMPPQRAAPASSTALLNDARELADRGRLNEAEAICRRLEDRDVPQEEVLYVLGEIAMARRDYTQAESYFRKTLFLRQAHPEALLRLTLLVERRGDLTAASRYRQRLEKQRSQNQF